MSEHRVLLTSAAAGLLVLAASSGVAWSFRLTAAAIVAVLVAAGQRWRLPPATAAGLLGLVMVVGTGPAGTAGAWELLAWGVPTWTVVLAAAAGRDPEDPGTPHPAPRDTATRLRLVAGESAAVLAAVPLVVVAAGAGAVPAAWAAVSGVVLVALLLTGGVRSPREARRGHH